MTGRCVKLHLPLTGSLGATRPSRWPTLEDSTYWSLSKYSPSRLNPPRAREMSSATDGFSAIMSVLPIDFHVQCSAAPVEGAVGCPGIIRGEFLAVQVEAGRRRALHGRGCDKCTAPRQGAALDLGGARSAPQCRRRVAPSSSSSSSTRLSMSASWLQ